MPPAESRELLAEINDCEACQVEHAGITNALRVTRQALGAASPAEEFWPGYHSRLQSRLNALNEPGSSNVKPQVWSMRSRLWNALGALATSSVRVPLPAALAVLLFVGVLSLSARSNEQPNVIQAPPVSVETRTVQVPVIQEKVVTQVVYLKQRKPRHKNVERANLNTDDVTAEARPASSGRTTFSLVGFKPAPQVNLTIIKGTTQDEK
jgi:hypothetical protein